MNMIEIIKTKRDKKTLNKEQIFYFINGITSGKIPDYQASALLMAIYFNKLSEQEIFDFTEAMTKSGEVIDLSNIDGFKVDKHSSGGVGDKTTLIVGPIAAAAGVKVPKMSGRGLGFTGGTIDKLESIPGFKTSLEPEEFAKQVNDIGIAIIGQSAHIAKGDKVLYALRDVTATVDYMGLIATSIMSKKLASGSDGIVLDVKYGSGAFMKTFEEAKELAEIMVKIGRNAGKETVAAITSMEEPLGNAVGNSNEVIEAIETLKGNGPKDLLELSITLAGLMIYIGKKAKSLDEGKLIATEMINSGKALNKFRELIKAQGGNEEVINNYDLFEKAKYKFTISGKPGEIVTGINTGLVGISSRSLGAGRMNKDDSISMSAGIILNKKVNDMTDNSNDSPIAVFYTDSEDISEGLKFFEEAYSYGKAEVEKPKLIKDIVGLQ